jgi:hypothetical protein
MQLALERGVLLLHLHQNVLHLRARRPIVAGPWHADRGKLALVEEHLGHAVTPELALANA